MNSLSHRLKENSIAERSIQIVIADDNKVSDILVSI